MPGYNRTQTIANIVSQLEINYTQYDKSNA